jgi:predicted DNA-binding antitoxin AbrB/MazE fold protein
MTITVQATYENGVLKPAQPLPLDEREQVQVTIQRPTSVADRSYGLIGWTGDAEAFEQLFQECDTKRFEEA